MGILNWFEKIGKNTLFYQGCLTTTEETENYKKILNKLYIDFTFIDKKFCCGLKLLNAGYEKQARKLAVKNFEFLKENNIKKIITNCPECYYMFKYEYPKLVREWDIETEHIVKTILEPLKNANPKFKEIETVTYHDPCYLARFSDIFNEPREILKLLGSEIKEMKHNKRETLCCGAGGNLNNFPKLSEQIAENRLKEIPESVKIITSCSLCHSQFRKLTEKSEEFSSFVLRKLEEAGI